MEAVNQEQNPASTGNLRCNRAASTVHPAPVQTLKQGTQLGCSQAHHAILDRWPLEPAGLQPLVPQSEMQGYPRPRRILWRWRTPFIHIPGSVASASRSAATDQAGGGYCVLMTGRFAPFRRNGPMRQLLIWRLSSGADAPFAELRICWRSVI